MAKLLRLNNKLVRLNNKLVYITAAAPPVGISGCVLHLKFNDNANDSSGNNYTFTDSNVSYVAGKLSNAASYNGSAYTARAYNAAHKYRFVNSQTRSWECWTKPAGTGSVFGDGLITASGNNGDGFDVYYTTDSFGLYNDINSPFGSLADATARDYPVGSWYHVVLTYNGDGDWEFFVNSVSAFTHLSAAGSWADSTSYFCIGDIYEGTVPAFGNLPYNGVVDNLRIFNKVLSQTEINTLFAGGTGLEDGVAYA